MIQKSTVFKPADNCGILRARVFHVYKSSKGRVACIGDFVKCSALEVLPDNPLKKKQKLEVFLFVVFLEVIDVMVLLLFLKKTHVFF